ncbi:hypothetical protein FHX10_002571 [Rhizobium sp. BK591]|nr:hypothetical protein [Rhizobium sp. BK591]MBB3743078.1 hypothetical protein [Rhizobium sp. BK591]
MGLKRRYRSLGEMRAATHHARGSRRMRRAFLSYTTPDAWTFTLNT